MGNYLNPGNSGFAEILTDKYVDKTGLISVINDTIGTKKKLTCISRPRRFGKSYAAQMLCAYYDRTVDSHEPFEEPRLLAVTNSPSYKEHLNKYNVIYLNMTDVMGEVGPDELIPFIKRGIIRELKEVYPDTVEVEGFVATLDKAVEMIGSRFIMIIDEWDAPLRELPETGRTYLDFLRSLFKSSVTTPKIFAAV